MSVTLVIAAPKGRGRPDRKQDGGEPAYEPDEDDDLEDDEALPDSPEEADNRRIMVEAAKALRGESKNPDEAIDEFLEVYGREELEALRQMVSEEEPPEKMAAGGRLVEGPGRGLDDRIAARAGKQPVLLSDGEFVVPADVVSHLGDGSTKAGVRALEGMMARVRRQKTGTRKQAGKIDLKKALRV